MRARKAIHLRAHAKINWTLEVLGKRDDGFHEVDTLMQTVSLHDELWIEPRRRADCVIECSSDAVPTDRTNLIWKAWDLMRREFPDRVGGIHVELLKRIPAGAGLGGGSSDAAATLIGINRLFELRLRKTKLAELAARLGSDVPFFIYGGLARAQGRGEIITPIPSRLARIPLVIVYPGFPSPTAKAYQALGAPSCIKKAGGPTATNLAAKAAQRGNFPGLLKNLTNSFDSVLTGKNARYGLLKKRMAQASLERIMLSGSGSACFGVAKTPLAAREATLGLQHHYPDSFAVVTSVQRMHLGRRE